MRDRSGRVLPASAETGLGWRRWPALTRGEVVVLVPLGSTEQHGPHLPQVTDAIVADAVAHGAARALLGRIAVTVAPAQWYGASGEHEGFPGTISIGHEGLLVLLVELGRSACRWAGGVVFVNGHGGNHTTLVKAVEQLRYEGRAVAWTACDVPPGLDVPVDAHAGRTETSLMRYLAGWSVRNEAIAAGCTAPLSEIITPMRRSGVQAVSPNGVLGDPTGATPEEGRRLFEAMVERLAGSLLEPDVDRNGRLNAPPAQEAPGVADPTSRARTGVRAAGDGGA